MRKNKNYKINTQTLLLLIAMIIIFIITIGISYAYYYQEVKSPLTTTFNLKYSSNQGYLRAYVYTYWTDAQSNEIAGKNSWELSEKYIDSDNWTKIGDYYYYNALVDIDVASENLPTLVNDNAENSVSDSNYNPVYKVMYEVLEIASENDKNSSAVAWDVVYDNGSWKTDKN